jgi:hypothetical protein
VGGRESQREREMGGHGMRRKCAARFLDAFYFSFAVFVGYERYAALRRALKGLQSS